MKRGKKIILTIAVVFGVMLLAFAGIMLNAFSQMNKEIDAISINHAGVSAALLQIPDGEFTGEYSPRQGIAAQVKVIVKDHRIEKIELMKHETGRGKPAEVLTEKVVEAQSLNVDTISGATGSSKVILKAIENALLTSQ